MLCNWCHKQIPQREEYREKSQGRGYWSTYRGTGSGSYNYESGGYYHIECGKKYREGKNKYWWIAFGTRIGFGVAIIISVGLGILFKSVLVGALGVLLVFISCFAFYFGSKGKLSRVLKDSKNQLKEFENKLLVCQNCKQKYFDFYSQRKPNEDYVFKHEEGYCSPCTHELFYPETISKCKVCKETIYVKDNKESPEICQYCYEEKEKQEKIRERIKREKEKKSD